MRIMITGGGTGGHTSPAIAAIEELRRRDTQLCVQWVGRTGGFEAGVSAAHSVPFRGLPVEGWPRRSTWRKAWVAAKLVYSVCRAALLVRVFRPQVVLGVGGYVSLPLGWAAQRMGIPTVLHEQNKRLGMANQILAPRAARILLSYEDTEGEYPREHAQVVGNPVRSGFADPPDTASARKKLGLDTTVPVVLVCGGSQGARSINQAMRDLLPHFHSGEVQFLWMTGKDGYAEARAQADQAQARTLVFRYIDDMVAACAAADLIISRSGASTTAELAMMGKPSILVPYPHATDNHQEKNARAFEAAGAADVLLDSECTGNTLAERLKALLQDPDRLRRMAEAAHGLAKPGAAETLVEGILELVFKE